MRVKAKQYMYYQRREYHAGDEYDMDDREAQDAKLLQTLGKIEIIDIPKGEHPPPLKYRTAHVAAEQPQAEEPKSTSVSPMTAEANPIADTGAPRRYYRRRDMKAGQ